MRPKITSNKNFKGYHCKMNYEVIAQKQTGLFLNISVISLYIKTRDIFKTA